MRGRKSHVTAPDRFRAQNSAAKLLPRKKRAAAFGFSQPAKASGHLPDNMKLRYFAVLLGMMGAALGETGSELRTVASVDLNRYAGKWYEVARYPNWFEKNCVSDVTAEYSLMGNGKLKVVNSCRKPNGKSKASTGSARVVDKQTNAKLKVTFFWPFDGDYWVIDLDPDYRYAVVSEPQRKYLWILSRTPKLDSATYEQITGRLREKGFDPARLIRPKQE